MDIFSSSSKIRLESLPSLPILFSLVHCALTEDDRKGIG